MPYLTPHDIEKRVSIRAVNVLPYAGSFAFSVTWEEESGARYHDPAPVELPYPSHSERFVDGSDNSALIFEIRLELERSGPARAEQLGINLDAYYAAIDEWNGRVTVHSVADDGTAFTTLQEIPDHLSPTYQGRAQAHRSDPERTASGTQVGR